MKIRAASALVVFLMLASTVQAQRSRSGGDGGGRSGGQRPSRPEPPRSPIVNVPTMIVPMTNPVAPITNPIMPFIRYGPVPTVVIPQATPRNDPRFDRRDDSRDDRRDHRRREDYYAPVVVGGFYLDPYYFDPYYYNPYYYDPFYNPQTPVSIPGQLPDVSPGFDPPSSLPSAPPSSYPLIPNGGAQQELPQHITITPQAPPLTVVPPAIGTSKAEAMARYGEPWGSTKAGGQETLYFNGGLVVVFVDGQATQIK